MTKLERAAMQQALEYCEDNMSCEAANVLKLALAEQAEPMTYTELINANCRYTTPLMAEQAEQEPVGYVSDFAMEWLKAELPTVGSIKDVPVSKHEGIPRYPHPLYAAPVSIEAAVLAEREACAKVCESGIDMWPGEYHEEWNDACEDRAAAIRARNSHG